MIDKNYRVVYHAKPDLLYTLLIKQEQKWKDIIQSLHRSSSWSGQLNIELVSVPSTLARRRKCAIEETFPRTSMESALETSGNIDFEMLCKTCRQLS
mmetsp:Transcript_12616/g.14501  ORF Transcript_12616/g.14501 Transcript_12616/m.14501 type:complete len:97 (+) Transcript_12616:86-376(+)